MRTLRIIFNSFKCCWYLLNFFRKFILNVLLIIIFFTIINIYFNNHYIFPTVKKGALVLDLVGTIVDKPIINNKIFKLGQELIGTSRNKFQENSLFDIVSKLRKAKNDKNITGIILLLKNLIGADQTSLQYIGKVLQEFKNIGKPIYAVGDNYNQTQYFLASYANKIYLTPQGSVNLYGISTNSLYYKSLLKKLKVNSHIFRVGNYKSAVEPILRDNMSNAARDADKRWITILWNNYLKIVANNRNIGIEQIFPDVQIMLDRLNIANGDTAVFALNNKWIDKIATRSTIENELIKIFGCNKKNKSLNTISIYDYQSSLSKKKQ